VARDFGYPLPAEFADDANSIESVYAGSKNRREVLAALLGSPAHHPHLLGEDWFLGHRDIGVGVNHTEVYGYWIIHTAYPEPDGLRLTGIVYEDGNMNGRPDLGEGLPGVTVGSGAAGTITDLGGGWTLEVEPGRHRVVATGGGFVGRSSSVVSVQDYNAQIDFVSGVAAGRAFEYGLCRGRLPTIVGSSGNDVISGTPGDDIIFAGAGDDEVHAQGGNDIVCGGPGDDFIQGGTGRDRLEGEAGSDSLFGQGGADVLAGRAGDDLLVGGAGPDRGIGGSGNDICRTIEACEL
jgi:Ca2+-binding RTX toxin-like protein